MILDVGAASDGTCKGTTGFYKQNIYTNIHCNDTKTEQKLQVRRVSAGEAASAGTHNQLPASVVKKLFNIKPQQEHNG